MESLFSQEQVHNGGRLHGRVFLPIRFLAGDGIRPFQNQGPQGITELVCSGLRIKGGCRRESTLNGRVLTIFNVGIGFAERPSPGFVQLEGPFGGFALELERQSELFQKDVLEDRPKDAFANHVSLFDSLIPIEMQMIQMLWPSWDFMGNRHHTPVANPAALEADSTQRWVFGEGVCQMGDIFVEESVFRQIQGFQRRILFHENARQYSAVQDAIVSLGVGQALPRQIKFLQLASIVTQNLVQDVLRFFVGHVSVQFEGLDGFGIDGLQEMSEEVIGKVALLKVKVSELGEVSECLVKSFHHMHHLGSILSNDG